MQEYRGQKIVQHSGAIDGMQSMVAMIPERKLGVLLTNGLRTKLATAVELRVLDAFLGRSCDRSQRCHEAGER